MPTAQVPARASHRGQRSPRAAWWVLWILVAVLLAAVLVVDRNFWFDEAMAYQAVARQGFAAPGQPLLHYEQAMPYGVYVIDRLLIGWVGLTENLLRIPGLALYVVGLIALARATRMIEGTLGRLAAMAAGGLAMWIVFEAAMFKQYAFEFAAGALVVATGWALLRSRLAPRSLVAFTAVSIVALPFSNTVAFMTAPVLVAVVVVLLVDDRAELRRRLVPLVVAAVVYLAVFGAYYLAVMKPSSVYQLSLPFYSGAGLGSLGHALATLWAPTGKPVYAVFGVLIFAVIVIGAVLTVRAATRQREAARLFPYLVLAIALAVMAAGVVTGLSPFSDPRHVLYALPAIGLAFGAATQSLAGAVRPALRRSTVLRIGAAALVAVTALGFAGIAVYGATKKQEEVGRILQANAASCPTTYVEYTFQPAAQLYIARDRLPIALKGVVDSRSGFGHDSWLSRETDHLAAYDARAVSFFRAHPGSCLLAMPVAAQDAMLKALTAAGVDCPAVDRKAGIGLYRCRP